MSVRNDAALSKASKAKKKDFESSLLDLFYVLCCIYIVFQYLAGDLVFVRTDSGGVRINYLGTKQGNAALFDLVNASSAFGIFLLIGAVLLTILMALRQLWCYRI